jgi:hypothetical protein
MLEKMDIFVPEDCLHESEWRRIAPKACRHRFCCEDFDGFAVRNVQSEPPWQGWNEPDFQWTLMIHSQMLCEGHACSVQCTDNGFRQGSIVRRIHNEEMRGLQVFG